jgi:hypothetical protein
VARQAPQGTPRPDEERLAIEQLLRATELQRRLRAQSTDPELTPEAQSESRALLAQTENIRRSLEAVLAAQ